MIEGTISILNAKLETTGRIDKRYCLTEKRERSSDGVNVPYEYKGNGELNAIDIDSPSLSWWRVVNPLGPLTEVDTTAAVNKLQGSFDLRLVVLYRRKESTADNQFTPSWLANDLRKLLTFSNGDLKTTLKASEVSVSVTSTDFDTPRIWAEEFEGLELTDPKYTNFLVALDITIDVTARRDCWDDECDYDTDILHIYDFCVDATYNRLTQAQRDCLTTRLCGSAADATVNVNGSLWATVASGGTLNGSVHDTADNDVGTIVSTTEIEIADSQAQVNGVNTETILATATHDQQIHDSAGADVGTAANPSVVSDSTITINGASLGATGDVVAEGSLDIDVNLNGSPAGSWSGTSWDITSTQPTLEIDFYSDAGLTTPISTAEYGDTVYIDITETGITSTSFVLSFDGDLDIVKTTASSPYTWVVDSLGVNTVYAQGKDGSGNTAIESNTVTFTVTLDTDAQAYIDAVTCGCNQTKINIHNLVTTLKDDGIWDKLYALYPIWGNDTTTHKWNMINPLDTDAAFRLTFNGGVQNFNRYVLNNNTNSYADTHFNPSTDYTSTSDASMGIYNNRSDISNRCAMGVGEIFFGVDSIAIYPSFSGSYYGNVFGATLPLVANTDSDGLFVVTRGSSSSFSFHKRGSSTLDTTSTQGINLVPNGNIWIGAGNTTTGSTGNTYSNALFSWAFIGEHLTTSEITDLYDAFVAFDEAAL